MADKNALETQSVLTYPYNTEDDMPDLDRTSFALIMQGQRQISEQMAENHRVLRAEVADTRRELKDDVFRLRTDNKEEILKVRTDMTSRVDDLKTDHSKKIEDVRLVTETNAKLIAEIKNKASGGKWVFTAAVGLLVFILLYGEKILAHIH